MTDVIHFIKFSILLWSSFFNLCTSHSFTLRRYEHTWILMTWHDDNFPFFKEIIHEWKSESIIWWGRRGDLLSIRSLHQGDERHHPHHLDLDRDNSSELLPFCPMGYTSSSESSSRLSFHIFHFYIALISLIFRIDTEESHCHWNITDKTERLCFQDKKTRYVHIYLEGKWGCISFFVF